MSAFYIRIIAIIALTSVVMSDPQSSQGYLVNVPPLVGLDMVIPAGPNVIVPAGPDMTTPTGPMPPLEGTLEVQFPPILLGTAEDFVILTKTGISTVPASVIVGDIGASPIAVTALTGFTLTAHSSNQYSESAQVTGRAYAANHASPTPSKMTTAIDDMETAYTDAMGRALVDSPKLNIKAGLIAGTVFTKGIYRWGSDVAISSDIYFKGDENTRFLMQSTGNVVMSSGAKMLFIADQPGGNPPNPKNIVWVAAGYLDVGTTAHAEGVFLVKTKAVFKTGSSLIGRVLAQTACTLDTTTIYEPDDTFVDWPSEEVYVTKPVVDTGGSF
jgi:hypothetical protein